MDSKENGDCQKGENSLNKYLDLESCEQWLNAELDWAIVTQKEYGSVHVGHFVPDHVVGFNVESLQSEIYKNGPANV